MPFSGKSRKLALANLNHRMKRVLFLVLALGWALRMAAQVFPYAYITRSVEDGLSQPNVTALLSDSRGSLWIGTRNGLNRFDRREITVYTAAGERAVSLADNLVTGLDETEDGTVWIRTGLGLSRYQPRLNSFETVLNEPCYASLPLDGGILFGGNGFLFHFPADADAPERLYPFGRDFPASDYRIVAMVRLNEGEILLGTSEKGLFRYTLGGEARPFSDSSAHQLNTLYRTSGGLVYAAYYGDGIRRYGPGGQEQAHFTASGTGLTNDYVQAFAEYDGALWVATDGGGICLLTSPNGDFQPLLHDAGDPASLPSNSITVLYPDSSGTLWAGTVKHGFFQVRKNYIRTLREPFGLLDNAVVSLYRDPDGTLWVGTDGGGLHRFDAVSGRFAPLPGTHGKVLSIAGYDDRRLLVCLFMEGFFLVDRLTGRQEPFTLVDPETNRLECFWGYIPRVGQVSPRKLYFLSYSAWAYDLQTKAFTQMRILGNTTASGIRMACSDATRSFFYKGDQVFEVRQEDDVIRPLFRTGDGGTVTSVAFDGDRTVWVGTDRGLGRYDLFEEKYETVPTGLFDSVTALELDAEGRLWICARNQLLTYLCAKDRFLTWSTSDGFHPNDIKMLYQNATDPDFLYMGGSGGLVQVDRSIPVPEAETPEIFLDRVEVDGMPALSRMAGKTLTLPWSYQSLHASFLVKDRDMFRRPLFRFTINGDLPRTVESTDPRLTLATLSPGTYHILVSCLTKDGRFTEPAELLEVFVRPPWYASAWFRVLLVLALVAAAIWGLRAVSRKQELENKSSMAHFLEEVLQDTDTPEMASDACPDPEFKARLDAAIRQHLSDSDLDVQFLTEELAMSRTILYGKVKQVTGLGIKDYINRLRIERSVDLLLHTNKNINEIANEVGFAYPRYFSTSFKNLKGVTPTRFKQENRPPKTE